MPYEIAGYSASGNVSVSRFVRQTGTPFVAAQAVANSEILGVSSAASLNPYGVTAFYGVSAAAQSYAATDGNAIAPIYGPGANTVLYINATVSAGQFLASDASGYGVVATAGQNVGAVATEGGFANQLIRVVVVQTLKAS